MLEAIYKKGDVFEYSKVYQCDNGSEFKCDVTKFLEIHNAEEQQQSISTFTQLL